MRNKKIDLNEKLTYHNNDNPKKLVDSVRHCLFVYNMGKKNTSGAFEGMRRAARCCPYIVLVGSTYNVRG